jgi:hypothetical protein
VEMRYFRQRRLLPQEESQTHSLSFGGDDDDTQGRRIESERRDEELLTMAVNHLTAFVLIFYGLYAFCRFGLGYDAIRDPPPPSFTIEIPGLTNTQSHTNLRGSDQTFD